MVGALAARGRGFAVDAEIELSLGEPGVVISPHLYGHFIEHLGGVIYDGVWVGRNSSIPFPEGAERSSQIEPIGCNKLTLVAQPYLDRARNGVAIRQQWRKHLCRLVSLNAR